MPTDALLVTMAVVAVFVAFAWALAWADRQTSARRLGSDTTRLPPRPSSCSTVLAPIAVCFLCNSAWSDSHRRTLRMRIRGAIAAF